MRPRSVAWGVIWPIPVAASEPWREHLIDAIWGWIWAGSEWTKIFAALGRQLNSLVLMRKSQLYIYLIGPTVWLELGPTPMENKSNVEITACSARTPSGLPSFLSLITGWAESKELSLAAVEEYSRFERNEVAKGYPDIEEG